MRREHGESSCGVVEDRKDTSGHVCPAMRISLTVSVFNGLIFFFVPPLILREPGTTCFALVGAALICGAILNAIGPVKLQG